MLALRFSRRERACRLEAENGTQVSVEFLSTLVSGSLSVEFAGPDIGQHTATNVDAVSAIKVLENCRNSTPEVRGDRQDPAPNCAKGLLSSRLEAEFF